VIESIFYGTFLGRDRLSPARFGYLLLVWAVIPTWIVVHMIETMIGFYFFAGLSGALRSHDPEHRVPEVSLASPFLTFSGDIGVHDLRIRMPDDEDGTHFLSAKRVLIDLPNFGAIYTLGAFSKRRDSGQPTSVKEVGFFDSIDHVGVAIDGLQADIADDMPPVLRDFGTVSAAPFEAEGCQRDRRWLAADLANMGVKQEGVDLHLILDTDEKTHEVRLQGSLDSPNSSRVAFTEHFRARNLSTLAMGDDRDRANTYERIEVSDAGFNRARNAFCAKRDKVTEQEFIERHIGAIQRDLQAHGMHAGADMERIYRAYLAHGTLLIEANPSTTINRRDYDQYSVADQMRMYNAKISSGGSPVPLVLESTPARPIPSRHEGSTWDFITQETANPEGVQQEIAMPSGSAQPAPTVAAAPAIAPAVAPAATPHWASSLPKPASASHGPAMLQYDELSHHVGGRVLITTQFGDLRDVTIESYAKNEIVVRAYVTGGYMTQHIQRSQIRLIQNLD